MNNNNYDYIILGTEPAGLTMAYYLGKIGKKCLLVDKNNNIGGSYISKKINGLYYDNGPKLISNSFFNLKHLLHQFGTSFNKQFTKYNFDTSTIGSDALETFTLCEKLILCLELIRVYFEKDRNMSLKDFFEHNSFSFDSIEHSDKILRLINGGTIENYNLQDFLEIFNQELFYNLYVPNKPIDLGIFKLWFEQILKTQNVDILLDSNYYIKYNNNNISKIIINNQEYFANKYINSTLNYRINNKYSITFHWDTKIDFPKITHFPKTDWGLTCIILSDYMEFNNKNSVTVISCIINKITTDSTFINKPAESCNEKEILQETFRQFKESFSNSFSTKTLIKSLFTLNTSYFTSFLKPNDTIDIPYPTYSIINNQSYTCDIYDQDYYFNLTDTNNNELIYDQELIMTTTVPGALSDLVPSVVPSALCDAVPGAVPDAVPGTVPENMYNLVNNNFISIEKSIINAIMLFNNLETEHKIKIFDIDNFIEFIKFCLVFGFIFNVLKKIL
jgi:hypothetical protein